MRLGLCGNSTLESLELWNITSDSNDTLLWREDLSFLRTNTALKALHMTFDRNATAIRMEVLAMLYDNIILS
jgi:hypothetical protein